MSHYLVTGGAGFIGSHLVEALLHRGESVTVLDDLSSGSERNLAGARACPRFAFVRGRAERGEALDELVDAADVVVHLAATVGVLNIINSPVTTIVNNIDGTEAVLTAAARRRPRVIVASTSEVYGKSTALPFVETGDLVFGPTTKSRWSYATSKVVDEFLALAYWREFKVPAVVVRLFNTIGPRQVGRYGMVVPRFMGQALRGQDLTVYGTGRQSRCFTDVADVVEWLVRLAGHPAAPGQVLNLGNPEEITIADLARRIIAVAGATVGIQHVPYEAAYEEGFEDMERRVPDISRVRALTGYAPRVALDDSLRRIRDWFLEEGI